MLARNFQSALGTPSVVDQVSLDGPAADLLVEQLACVIELLTLCVNRWCLGLAGTLNERPCRDVKRLRLHIRLLRYECCPQIASSFL